MTTHLAQSSIGWDAQVSLKLLVESAPIALVIVNQQGQILYVNAKLEEMFGYTRDELLGHPVEVLMPSRFHNVHVQHRQAYARHPHVRNMGSGMDLWGTRKDGSEFPLEAGLSHLQVGDEMYVIATLTDITKRKQIEEELERRVIERTRELERRQQVAEGLRAILSILNSNRPLSETLQFIVAQARWLLHADACAIYSRETNTGRFLIQAGDGLREDLVPAIDRVLEQLLAQPVLLDDGPVLFAESGEPMPVLDSFMLDRLPPGHLDEFPSRVYITVPLKDKDDIYGVILLCYEQLRHLVSADVELAVNVAEQTVLAIANARLHAQIERTAVTAERNRIARDLHDAVTQTLFSASMIAEVLPVIWQRNELEGRRRLAELRELTRGALAEMRTLLLELRPAKLTEVDLADLLRQLAEAIAGRARVPVNVHVEGDAEIPADVKIALYRIAQEALNNVAKHAQARHAEIILRRSPKLVELTITDDGVGFVFERILPNHLGLGIMRERAEAIGATLNVLSHPGQGTTVAVQWAKANIAGSDQVLENQRL